MAADAPREVAAASDALTAAAAAVTGPDTPTNAAVKSAPPKWAVWALVLAGPAVSAMLVGCVLLLAFVFWPGALAWRSESIGEKIVLGVSSVAMALAIILGLVVFRLASGGLKSVSAKALGGSLEINTDDDLTAGSDGP